MHSLPKASVKHTARAVEHLHEHPRSRRASSRGVWSLVERTFQFVTCTRLECLPDALFPRTFYYRAAAFGSLGHVAVVRRPCCRRLLSRVSEFEYVSLSGARAGPLLYGRTRRHLIDAPSIKRTGCRLGARIMRGLLFSRVWVRLPSSGARVRAWHALLVFP